MSGRCATCRWWLDPTNPETRLDSPHLHMPTPPPWLPKACALTASRGNMQIRDFDQTKAVALDGTEFAAMLYTTPDFGCVQWEAVKD